METPKASAKQEHGTGKDRLDFSTRDCGGFPQTLAVEPGVGCGRN